MGSEMCIRDRYADLHGELLRAAREYAADVKGGSFPGPEHTF